VVTADDQDMTSGNVPPPDLCEACGGTGWKFLTLRRSASGAAGAAESGLVRRRRIQCVACDGTGSASGKGEAS